MATFPDETTYSEIELDLIDNEPPGLFPQSQETYWGQIRKIFADYLQTQIADMLDQWYQNLDPRTVDANDIGKWEKMLGLVSSADLTLSQRRASVLARMRYGGFTRAARQAIVEALITPSFGDTIALTTSGVPLDADGVEIFSGLFDLSGAYTITEDVENFSYEVDIDVSIEIDTAVVNRALGRVTPAGINFTVTHGVIAPPTRTYGTGTYGSGTYGG